MSGWERRVVRIVALAAWGRVWRAHGQEYHDGCCLDRYFGECRGEEGLEERDWVDLVVARC